MTQTPNYKPYINKLPKYTLSQNISEYWTLTYYFAEVQPVFFTLLSYT